MDRRLPPPPLEPSQLRSPAAPGTRAYLRERGSGPCRPMASLVPPDPKIPRGRAGPRPGRVPSRAPAPGLRLAREGLRQETRARKMASASSFPPPALDSCGRMRPRAAAGETLLPARSPPRAATVRAGGRAEAVARAHAAPRRYVKRNPLCKPSAEGEGGQGAGPMRGGATRGHARPAREPV